jgi:CBS domain-containing protein
MPKAFDFSNPPFDRLAGAELERFKASLDLAFLRRGETVIRAGDVPASFYIIIKGAVREVDGSDVVALHGSNDCFDVSLLVERRCRHDFVVEEEAICYLLPVDELLDLTANNKAFAEFFYRDLSLKLEALAARKSAAQALQPVTMARVREAYIHPPVYLDSTASIFEAAQLMKAAKATSLLVRHGTQVGIATGYDLRDVAILQRMPLETPLGLAASYDLIGIEAEDALVEALLRMARHGVRRLVVYDRGEIAGVLEQVDLLSFLSSQSHIMAVQIERASTIDDLARASAQLPMLVEVLHRQGTKMSYVTRLVAELSRKLMARLFAMLAPAELQANACLFVMGSEGRADQVLRTDQDNGLILRDGYASAELERVRLELTEALIGLGYPRCPGEVMVSNPTWSKPLAGFRDDLRRWVMEPDEAALMNVAIFIDAAPVAGDEALLADARRHLFELTRADAAFCRRFARAIESFSVPLGIFSSIIVGQGENRDALDIKKGGIFPIVHGVRALALEREIWETNTTLRIRRLEEHAVFDHAFAVDLIEAYNFLLGLRLEARLTKLKLEQPPDNLIRPADLNKFERDLLKDSLAIANRFRDLVRYHFQLELL